MEGPGEGGIVGPQLGEASQSFSDFLRDFEQQIWALPRTSCMVGPFTTCRQLGVLQLVPPTESWKEMWG